MHSRSAYLSDVPGTSLGLQHDCDKQALGNRTVDKTDSQKNAALEAPNLLHADRARAICC
jgi:hypothetical protein